MLLSQDLHLDALDLRPRFCATERTLAADRRVGLAGHFANNVLEQLVSETCRVVQPIRGTYLGRDHELARADECLESNRIILQGPCEPHAIRELGQPVPSERANPGAAEGLDERPKVKVRGEVRLEDGDAGIVGPQGSWTQDLHGPRGHTIAEFGVLDEIVLGQSMEGPGQLLWMDAESSAEALECDLGGRVLREKLEDLPVVLPQVEREIRDSRFPALGHHVDRWTTSAKDKAASARIEREKGDRRSGILRGRLRRQIATPDDLSSVDRHVRSREGTAEVEVRLVLAARDLVVRPHRDVYVPGNDRVLEEPRASVRIESDIQVTEQILRALRLLPFRADEVLVLGGREFRHTAAFGGDPHAADPTARPCDRLVEHNGAVPGFHVRDDERLPGGEVRHVLPLIEILLCDDAVLDSGGVADEIARELRAIRMGNLHATLLCERLRHLAARSHDLLAVHGACREDHLPPRREVEAIGARTGLRYVSQAEPRTPEPVPLRAAIPFLVVGR